MALWGKTDNVADRPNWIDLNNYPEGTELIFVDADEARVEANKLRGIHGPGWWLFRSYEDTNGNTRYKSELVVTLVESADNAGDDNDDTVAEDLSIEVEVPGNTYVVSPGDVSITATASVNGNFPLSYQWYDANTDEAVEGATSATLQLVGITAPQAYYVVVSASDKSAQSNTANVLED